MTGMTRLRLLALLIAGVLIAGMLLPGRALAAEPANPHIVLQASSETEAAVEAAGWTPDGKYVLTANGIGRNLVIWEAATGRIVDRAALPADPASWAGEMMTIEGVTVTPDGRTANVRTTVIDLNGGGVAVSRTYHVDLATRVAVAGPPAKSPVAGAALQYYVARQGAIATIYEGGTTVTPAVADKLLPVLPRSPDGLRGLKRTDSGLAITGSGARTLINDLALGFDDAALSPDGRMLVMVEGTKDDEGDGKVSTNILRYDIAGGRFLPNLNFPGTYGLIRWLDDARLLVSNGGASQDRDSEDADDVAPLSPSLIVDVMSGKIASQIPGRCYIAPVISGFIAADAGACRHGVKGGTTVMLYYGDAWHPVALADHAGSKINGIFSSPDGKVAAVILETGVNRNVLLAIDVATGKTIDELGYGDDIKVALIMSAVFTPDGSQLIVASNGGAALWPFGTETPPRQLKLKTSVPQLIATDGSTVLMSGLLDSSITRASLATGVALPSVDMANAISGGFLPGKPIFWSASASTGVRLWDTRTWQPIVSLYPIDGGNFIAVTPDGRYDTNLGPDASQFRWIVPDAPFQSLGPQTFMRDYFTPRLADKALSCRLAGDCAAVLPSLLALTSLNRVLPDVKIVAVEMTKEGEAIVRIEAREGVDPNAANGRTRSGLYNVRLFRNGRFVEHEPTEDNEVLHQNLDQWRKLNGWAGGADANGVWQFPMVVQLPTGAGQDKQVFTAYAFNEDRVKSDTARFEYTRPPVTPRQPRAYIVNIGIDTYDDPRLQLRFSAADAHLMGDRLATIPGYEVHRLDLSSTPGPDGQPRRVTKDAIRAAFVSLLGGKDFSEVRDLIKGFDTSALDRVTPDDLVIVTWSGHGWANKAGDFFLAPADAKWPANGDPDVASLVSSADLTMFLREIPAGEIAVIIDACHSGASVDVAAFKPGPMGDAGLGQLAYDKGMRILAATQASDVAIEDARVGQGLLTFALAGEGVTPDGGKADLNHDGRITLDEWLRYAVQRLPSLSADVKLGKFATARGFDRPGAAAPKAQEPALFDFTGQASPVILRTGVK